MEMAKRQQENKQMNMRGSVAACSPETQQIQNVDPCPEEWEVFHMMACN